MYFRLPLILLRIFGTKTRNHTDTDEIERNSDIVTDDDTIYSEYIKNYSQSAPGTLSNNITNQLDGESEKEKRKSWKSLKPSTAFQRKISRNRRSRNRSDSTGADRGWKPEIPFENLLNYNANKKMRKKVNSCTIMQLGWGLIKLFECLM